MRLEGQAMRNLNLNMKAMGSNKRVLNRGGKPLYYEVAVTIQVGGDSGLDSGGVVEHLECGTERLAKQLDGVSVIGGN